jgi:hypothetical protein
MRSCIHGGYEGQGSLNSHPPQREQLIRKPEEYQETETNDII